MADQWAPRINLPVSVPQASTGDTDSPLHVWLLCGCWGIQVQALILPWHAVYQLSHLEDIYSKLWSIESEDTSSHSQHPNLHMFTHSLLSYWHSVIFLTCLRSLLEKTIAHSTLESHDTVLYMMHVQKVLINLEKICERDVYIRQYGDTSKF